MGEGGETHEEPSRHEESCEAASQKSDHERLVEALKLVEKYKRAIEVVEGDQGLSHEDRRDEAKLRERIQANTKVDEQNI